MLTTPMLQEYLNTTKERDPLSIAYLAIFEHLTNYAPEVAHEMLSELKDQRSNLKLIASEKLLFPFRATCHGKLVNRQIC